MSSGARRAGFGIRLAAAVLDLVILSVLTLVLGALLGAYTGFYGALEQGYDPDESFLLGILGGMVGPVLSLPFFAFPYFLVELFSGRTLGKHILGISIADAGGSSATGGQLAARWLLKYGAFVLSLVSILAHSPLLAVLAGLAATVAIVGCFFALGESHQALHDRSAGTAVFGSKDLEQGLRYSDPDDWRDCGVSSRRQGDDEDWRDEAPEASPPPEEDDDSWREA